MFFLLLAQHHANWPRMTRTPQRRLHSRTEQGYPAARPWYRSVRYSKKEFWRLPTSYVEKVRSLVAANATDLSISPYLTMSHHLCTIAFLHWSQTLSSVIMIAIATLSRLFCFNSKRKAWWSLSRSRCRKNRRKKVSQCYLLPRSLSCALMVYSCHVSSHFGCPPNSILLLRISLKRRNF